MWPFLYLELPFEVHCLHQVFLIHINVSLSDSALLPTYSTSNALFIFHQDSSFNQILYRKRKPSILPDFSLF